MPLPRLRTAAAERQRGERSVNLFYVEKVSIVEKSLELRKKHFGHFFFGRMPARERPAADIGRLFAPCFDDVVKFADGAHFAPKKEKRSGNALIGICGIIGQIDGCGSTVVFADGVFHSGIRIAPNVIGKDFWFNRARNLVLPVNVAVHEICRVARDELFRERIGLN